MGSSPGSSATSTRSWRPHNACHRGHHRSRRTPPTSKRKSLMPTGFYTVEPLFCVTNYTSGFKNKCTSKTVLPRDRKRCTDRTIWSGTGREEACREPQMGAYPLLTDITFRLLRNAVDKYGQYMSPCEPKSKTVSEGLKSRGLKFQNLSLFGLPCTWVKRRMQV